MVLFQFCLSIRPNFFHLPSFFNQGMLRVLRSVCLPCVISSLLNPMLQHIHACPTDSTNNRWITTSQMLITICNCLPNVSTGRYSMCILRIRTSINWVKKYTRFAIYPTLNVRYNKMEADYSVLQTDKKKETEEFIGHCTRKTTVGLNVRPRVTGRQGKVLNFGTRHQLRLMSDHN